MAEQNFVKLLHVFPKEIWSQILEKVNFKTFRNLLTLSKLFASLGMSIRTQMLFPEVAERLFKFVLHPIDSPISFCGTKRRMILNCRLVCSAWKHGVDSFLESLDPHLALPPNPLIDKYPEYLWTFTTKLYCENYLGAINSKFYNHFALSHQDPADNPFQGRSVSITLGNAPTSADFMEQMRRILRQWGHQIWYAYFRITQFTFNGYLLFREFMGYLPNLKVIDVTVQQESENEGAIEEISRQIEDFPHYASLQRVKTRDLHDFVWKKLENLNPHVMQVTLSMWEDMLPDDVKEALRKRREEKARRQKSIRRRKIQNQHRYHDDPRSTSDSWKF